MKYILKLFGKSLVENLDIKIYEDRFSKLEKAVDLAIIENENQIENSSDLLYGLNLRGREMDLIEDMYYDLRTIPPEYSDGKYISEILITTSDNLSKDGDMIGVKKKIEHLKDHFNMMELPKNHEEFYIRSAIFQVFRSLDQFIEISNPIDKNLKY